MAVRTDVAIRAGAWGAKARSRRAASGASRDGSCGRFPVFYNRPLRFGTGGEMHLQAAVGSAGLVVILRQWWPSAASRQSLDRPHTVVDVINEAGAPRGIIGDAQARVT